MRRGSAGEEGTRVRFRKQKWAVVFERGGSPRRLIVAAWPAAQFISSTEGGGLGDEITIPMAKRSESTRKAVALPASEGAGFER